MKYIPPPPILPSTQLQFFTPYLRIVVLFQEFDASFNGHLFPCLVSAVSLFSVSINTGAKIWDRLIFTTTLAIAVTKGSWCYVSREKCDFETWLVIGQIWNSSISQFIPHFASWLIGKQGKIFIYLCSWPTFLESSRLLSSWVSLSQLFASRSICFWPFTISFPFWSPL